MIKSIKISNIALIDEVKVDFANGFNVFTGETGAGKSIIIDAIMLLLGGKFDKTIIKEGNTSARVEAMFEIDSSNPDSKVVQILQESGIEYDDIISLGRTININGKSEYRVNGEQTTMNTFKKVSHELLDIFGQHDNLKLLDSANHICYLDTFIGDRLAQYKGELRQSVAKLTEIKHQIAALGDSPEKRAREIEFLEYEIEDIERQNFVEGEEDELQSRRLILSNSEKIYSVLKGAIDDMESPTSMLGVLKGVTSSMGSVAGIDTAIDDCRDRLNSLRWELGDVIDVINNYVSSINYSEAELENIMSRIDLINDYKRKYGNSIADILQYLAGARDRMDRLRHCEEELAVLQSKKVECLEQIYSQSKAIHDIRVDAANTMQQMLEAELKELGMKNAEFVVRIDFPPIDDFESKISVDGLDTVEFLFSANLGQSVKSLDKIISGGELSRFALSFKAIMNIDEPDKTLIFDEVDAGIGGNTGSVVGKKLARISRSNQVLCITHLAQIASFADNHYKIVKNEDDERTYTTIYTLDNESKVEEISRMIGSIINISYANLHSNELIMESSNYKLSLG